ncbi:MAG: H-X9-DG-CTERM domain-containing protein [Planctomycetota bacterium]
MNASMKRLTLGQGLAALTAVSLMAVVAPPSLQRLRTRLQPVTCANNLRTCHQAWSVYGRQFGGVWIAPWDRYITYPSYLSQWPYTMTVYVQGGSVPEDPIDRYSGSVQLHCPTLKTMPPTNPWWQTFTTYSYATMGGHVDANTGQVWYAIDDYPVPDQMTHPASTILLHDIGGTTTEGGTNAWTYGLDNLVTTDPHDGKSNYLMCDGHVDLLAVEDLDETMWMSRWVPEEPAGEAD